MIPQDSAKFWFPKLAATWLCTEIPNTVFVDYNEELLTPALMGQKSAEYERLYYTVEAALHEIGEPAFIRTDLTSAKHAGKHAYRVDSLEGLNDALLTTLSAAQLKSYHSKVKSSAIMVRHHLNVKHDRTAFGGLPIANEWRVFADQNGVQCAHHYWPEQALWNHMDDGKEPPKDWVKFWIPTVVMQNAEVAAKAIGVGKWSADFVEDINGKWWLLDMATAGNSYHDLSCQYSGLDIQNRL
jgi:hypothetical protein